MNAVSAKHGGARTILESFVNACEAYSHHEFRILAGCEAPRNLPANVTWEMRPKSGVAAMMFTLFGVLLVYLKMRADYLISFNNINCALISSHRKSTYFHQLKALDPSLSEAKLWMIRLYLRYSSEPVVVQSPEVARLIGRMFSQNSREVLIVWPGIALPHLTSCDPEAFQIFVPVASPQSPHKNFLFVESLAKKLGSEWKISVTAPPGLVQLDPDCTNIDFIGTCSREDMFVHYQRSTICVLASTHETVGLPIFEALAVGTPVLTYDAPYIRGFKKSFGIDSGLIIARSVDEAANAIQCIARNGRPVVRSEADFTKSGWFKLLDMFE